MIAILGIRYRNYAHYTLDRNCLLLYGIAIVRSISFLFLDDYEGNANISVAIKSGSTVVSYGGYCFIPSFYRHIIDIDNDIDSMFYVYVYVYVYSS